MEKYKVQDSQTGENVDENYFNLPLYDINLYPDRKFEGRVHVLLWKSESYGNLGYLEYFKKMDEAKDEYKGAMNKLVEGRGNLITSVEKIKFPGEIYTPGFRNNVLEQGQRLINCF